MKQTCDDKTTDWIGIKPKDHQQYKSHLNTIHKIENSIRKQPDPPYRKAKKQLCLNIED